MGVDFFPCNSCKEIICDVGDYIYCEECGRTWCDEECGEHDRLILTPCDDCDTEEEAEEHGCGEYVCGYCRNVMATDKELLDYVLKKLGISKSELTNEYLRSELIKQ